MDVWVVPQSSCSGLDKGFLMDVGPQRADDFGLGALVEMTDARGHYDVRTPAPANRQEEECPEHGPRPSDPSISPYPAGPQSADWQAIAGKSAHRPAAPLTNAPERTSTVRKAGSYRTYRTPARMAPTSRSAGSALLGVGRCYRRRAPMELLRFLALRLESRAYLGIGPRIVGVSENVISNGLTIRVQHDTIMGLSGGKPSEGIVDLAHRKVLGLWRDIVP